MLSTTVIKIIFFMIIGISVCITIISIFYIIIYYIYKQVNSDYISETEDESDIENKNEYIIENE